MTPKPEINIMFLAATAIYDGPAFENEADAFEVCPTCKQAFDTRKLDLVFYHDQDGHRPKPTQ